MDSRDGGIHGGLLRGVGGRGEVKVLGVNLETAALRGLTHACVSSRDGLASRH